MSSGPSSTSFVLVSGGLVVVGACAFPDFQFRSDTSGGGGGGGPITSSILSAGGDGGGAAASSTSTGMGGVGGTPLPTDCTLYSTGECGPGRKCTVIASETGAAGCVDAGDHPPWSRCEVDTQCGEGFYCHDRRHTCHPLCQSAQDCGGLPAQCLPTFTIDGDEIPNLGTCTANCDPQNGTPCSLLRGPVNCVPDGQANLLCVSSGGGTFGDPCASSLDCNLGHACIDFGGGIGLICTPRCQDPDFEQDAFCPNGARYCNPSNPTVMYEGVTYGVCGQFIF
ncbi:MAG: hypothetical protein AAF715_14810 [Myxococcota bacterium]